MKAYTYESSRLIDGIVFEGKEFPFINLDNGKKNKKVFFSIPRVLRPRVKNIFNSVYNVGLLKYKHENKIVYAIVADDNSKDVLLRVKLKGIGKVKYQKEILIEGDIYVKEGTNEYSIDALFRLKPKQFMEGLPKESGEDVVLINDNGELLEMTSSAFNELGKAYYFGETVQD